MGSPRFLADEMVGRLARYLRMTGCDTAYAQGLSDDAIVLRARTENRILVTRDRRLAARVPGAVLLTSPAIEEQWRALDRAVPGLPHDVAFTRCTLCNGRLAPAEGPPGPGDPERPTPPAGVGRPLFRCATCGHLYWEGSHGAALRTRLAAWSGAEPR